MNLTHLRIHIQDKSGVINDGYRQGYRDTSANDVPLFDRFNTTCRYRFSDGPTLEWTGQNGRYWDEFPAALIISK